MERETQSLLKEPSSRLGEEREHAKENPNRHIKLTDKSMSVKDVVV